MPAHGLPFTDRELEIMRILWDEGSATVREARQEVGEETPYTSVLSIFQTLEKKGYARHERDGRAYRYYPVLGEEEAQQQAIEYVARTYFKGDTTLLADRVRHLNL